METKRPDNLKHVAEIDPLEALSIKLKEETKVGIDYNNDSHKEYCSKRNLILNFLKSLIELHNFRESVYFLAVFYLDIIILSNPNFNYEMAAYSCFLLASKIFIKLKFF